MLGQALCLDVRGSSLLLAPSAAVDSSYLAGNVLSFQIKDTAGVLRVTGILSGTREVEMNRVAHRVLELVADPDGVRETNKRAHYRVSVAVKGEIAPYDPEAFPWTAPGNALHRHAAGALEPSDLEGLALALAGNRRPCVVRDLSTGGARLFLESPPPAPGHEALLDLALEPGEILRNLCCRILEARPQRARPPFDALVRLRFLPMASRAEARLGRFITAVQRELIQKGIG